MVGLYVHGALERCHTLRNTLDLKRISKLRYGDNANVKRINLENYDYVLQHRLDPRLEGALYLSMRRTSLLKKAKKWFRSCSQPAEVSRALGIIAGKD